MRQAVILAGGKGTRLASRLNGRPKPLIDVDGVPLLERQLNALHAAGIRDVLVLVQHAKEQISAFASGYDHKDMVVRLIEDGEPKGTGGSVLAAWDHLDESFLVVYGDTLFDVDLGRFVARHSEAKADVTLFVHPNDHPYDSDLVGIDPEGWVTGFHHAPHPVDQYFRNLVNAALYVIERNAIVGSRDLTVCDFVKDIFPRVLESSGRILAYESFEYIKDIGTPDRLDKAIKHLREGRVARASLAHRQKAIFLDRDGTLNVERGLVRSPLELELVEGAATAVRAINHSDYRAVLVTNQPVIARGEVTTDELDQIHAKLETDLGRERAYLDAIYYCPHHPDKGYAGEIAELKIECSCRKPKPGLLFKASADKNIDLPSSWIVGDSYRDVLAGSAAQVSTVLVGGGLSHESARFVADPDFYADDVGAAVDFILNTYSRLAVQFASIVSGLASGSVVLVGGAEASGKTTLCSLLVRELRIQGRSAERLGLDGFRVPVGEQTNSGTLLDRYDLAAVVDSLRAWLSGDPLDLHVPVYDRQQSRPVPKARHLSLAGDGVLVIDGVPSPLELPTDRPVLRIHVECDEDTRSARVDRKLARSNLTSTNGFQTNRSIDEADVILTSRRHADLIVNLTVEKTTGNLVTP